MRLREAGGAGVPGPPALLLQLSPFPHDFLIKGGASIGRLRLLIGRIDKGFRELIPHKIG
jgi:hypothetical protein